MMHLIYRNSGDTTLVIDNTPFSETYHEIIGSYNMTTGFQVGHFNKGAIGKTRFEEKISELVYIKTQVFNNRIRATTYRDCIEVPYVAKLSRIANHRRVRDMIIRNSKWTVGTASKKWHRSGSGEDNAPVIYYVVV